MNNDELELHVKVSSDNDGYDVTALVSEERMPFGELVALTNFFLHGSSVLLSYLRSTINQMDIEEFYIEHTLEINMLDDLSNILGMAMGRWLASQGEATCSCDKDPSASLDREDPADLENVHTIADLFKRNDGSFSPFDISFRFALDENQDDVE